MTGSTVQNTQAIFSFLEALVTEGEAVLETAQRGGTSRMPGTIVFADRTMHSKWIAGCRHLETLLGASVKPWHSILFLDGNRADFVQQVLGALRAILEIAQKGLLFANVEQLARAEIFDDLLEQADYLVRSNGVLPAGVLGRAVLEEHLRLWVDKAKLSTGKPKPTVNDYTQALYQGGKLDKIQLKRVEAMAAIGNACAHNKPHTVEDVTRLLTEVRDFLGAYGP